jgi:hypothetical protein
MNKDVFVIIYIFIICGYLSVWIIRPIIRKIIFKIIVFRLFIGLVVTVILHWIYKLLIAII